MKYKNNPYNIRSGSKWLGLVGSKNGFCEFDTLVHGIRAYLYLVLRSYRSKGVITIRDIIYRFAPPSENRTSEYLDYVIKYAGVSPYDVLYELPLTKLYSFAVSMAKMETGYLVSVSDFHNALNLVCHEKINS